MNNYCIGQCTVHCTVYIAESTGMYIRIVLYECVKEFKLQQQAIPYKNYFKQKYNTVC